MRTDLFDFELPEDRIALNPAIPRDSARLLVVDPGNPRIPLQDGIVRYLPAFLRPGDALVLNDTRVLPAALTGVRLRGELSSEVSFNLLKRSAPDRWTALARPAKKLVAGDRIVFPNEAGPARLEAIISGKGEAGEVELAFAVSGANLEAGIAAVGQMPLPPYIAGRRAPGDEDRASYQTIYAAHDGSVAAPTAGLHFTDDLFAALEVRGISRHFVTLHVGAGTFLPVKSNDTADHKMHSESAVITSETATALNETRKRGGRIVAAGTTSLRTLESAADETGEIQPWSRDTSIFITPGYRFKAVDVLLTNFHLPRSTLFMLVSAFSGLDTMRAAYAHAIASGYRFYSYGDACLLFRESTNEP